MNLAHYNHRDFSRCEKKSKRMYLRKVDSYKNICKEHGDIDRKEENLKIPVCNGI